VLAKSFESLCLWYNPIRCRDEAQHSFNKIEVTGVQSSLVVFLDMQVVAVNLNSTSDANIVVVVLLVVSD